jgi:hypothetical protein
MTEVPPPIPKPTARPLPAVTWLKAGVCLVPTILCQVFAHIVLIPRIETYYRKAELSNGEGAYALVGIAHKFIASEATMLMTLLAGVLFYEALGWRWRLDRFRRGIAVAVVVGYNTIVLVGLLFTAIAATFLMQLVVQKHKQSTPAAQAEAPAKVE